VEREARDIVIHELRLSRLLPDAIEFSVTCSKGTYVRTLGEDIARALGTCGHLGALRRTAVGAFAGLPAYSFEALEALADDPARDRLLLPVDAALRHLPAVELGAPEAGRFCHGQTVPVDGASAELPGLAMCRVYGPGARFIGLGETDDTAGQVRPTRVFRQVEPA
jgi:tRNA pseudouridine55 synthase